MYRYITPVNLGTLKRHEIIVFGCESGMPGEGLHGQSYAIPVVGRMVTGKTVNKSIDRFTEFASEHPDLVFYVLEIGHGCKIMPAYKIAMMFFEASKLPNVYLPSLYWDELEFGKEFESIV